MTRGARAAALTAALAWLAACAGGDREGTFHTVKPGETVYGIARHYRVPTSEVIASNDVGEVRGLEVGERLFIPGTSLPPADEPIRSSLELRPSSVDLSKPIYERRPLLTELALRERAREETRAAGGLAFVWPVHGSVSSLYGRRSRRMHAGVDIRARPGTAVKAAEAGRVTYSGNGLGAYGNVVIVAHGGGFTTLYAHNRRNRVRKGERVERGEQLAEVGASGNATGPHLHFELRRHDRARDPLLYLPTEP